MFVSSLSTGAPTQLLEVKEGARYAYRRDALAGDRELILLDNAGVGRSSGAVPTTVAGMAQHVVTFLDGVGVNTCDVLGFSLGGMIAQQMVLDRPTIFRRVILVGTAPRGGEDIMHLEKPRLAKHLQDPSNKGYGVLQKIFFTLTPSGQAAGASFVQRLAERRDDLDGVSGPSVANAQMAAFREWERVTGEPFAELRTIQHPTLVVNGVHDEMIPIANSYRLVENLPNAVLLAYPDAGHGSLFQYHEAFARQAAAFLSISSESAVY